MTFSVLEPDPSTYHLWRRFSMPTTSGPRDAIAVPSDVANNLTSAYTFLVSMIVLDTWVLVLLFLLLWYIEKNKRRGTPTTTATAIWNAKASPSDVVKLTAIHFRTHRKWSILLWMMLALFCLAAHYAIPIVVAPYIILDNAAPVAADTIYVPSLVGETTVSELKTFYLQAPSAFRAVGNTQTAISGKNPRVSVDKPVLLQELGDGEAIIRVGYRYSVSGVDFGLQHYPGLVLDVEGSCTTDYGSFLQSSVSDGIGVDTYVLWPGNPTYQLAINVSLFDGPMPQGFLRLGPPSSAGPPGNFTWAAIVSSVERLSATEGNDPWYLTSFLGNANGGPIYEVRKGRPTLSCWQNDVWSYKGHNSTITELTSEALPGLHLPEGLQTILGSSLAEPRIISLATQLGPQALASTTTSLGEFFDAEDSSFYRDIQRLVIASYVATTNVLTESTLFTEEHLGIPNFILGNDGQVQPGADEFVIWSSRVRTLSVRTIIVIPVIALSLFLLVICLIIFCPPLGKELDDQPEDTVEKPVNGVDEPEDIEKGPMDIEKGNNGSQDR
jgi:hypothetical protein